MNSYLRKITKDIKDLNEDHISQNDINEAKSELANWLECDLIDIEDLIKFFVEVDICVNVK